MFFFRSNGGITLVTDASVANAAISIKDLISVK